MNILDIINKKRFKEKLSNEEIDYVVKNLDTDEVTDYQLSALLMAICINGMEEEEIYQLTDSIIKSGEEIDLSNITGKKVDKHSTGGVGDKTTLVLLPLVASCGVLTPKMSGRGLGFTGGTIDKLESIPGFKVSLSLEEMKEKLAIHGLALACQTPNLVPADKKIYALRNATATASSLPLIVSSIMSKKIASGADGIIMDLKIGNGSLFKSIEEAREFATYAIQIGKNYNRKVICVFTDMNQPLGNAIGNSLEVLESIEVLKNEGPKDVRNLCIVLATFMVSFGLNISISEANNLVLENLHNGKAYEKFLEFISSQGGEVKNIVVSEKCISVKSKESGFVNTIKTDKLGELVRRLGGGRYHKDDEINYGVGVVLACKCGDFITEDEEILKIYMGDKDIPIDEFLECFEISMSGGKLNPLIYEVKN